MKEKEQLEQAIMALANERGPDNTICPSEAARSAFPDSWREQMEQTRSAAAHLQRQGLIRIEQNGVPVDIAKAKGPIRLRISEKS